MIICGLKLTHDGAVAVLDDDQLVFSVEMEKRGNSRRYSEVDDLATVFEVLAEFGYRAEDVDEWVIDGWDGEKTGTVVLHDHGAPLQLTTAPYRDQAGDPLEPGYHGVFPMGERSRSYTSYTHITGHLASAYATSPFARRGEESLVLVWDGGVFPRLYHVAAHGQVTCGGDVFPLIGHAYATAAHHFGPFRRPAEPQTVDDLSVAGKLMAFIALGTARPEIKRSLAKLFYEHFEAPTEQVADYHRTVTGFSAEPALPYLHGFFRALRQESDRLGVCDEDVLASVHDFLETLLVRRVTEKVRAWRGPGPWNLCFVGGCALNIKWNSALRAEPMFGEVWVPPFPNDSGSAIGAATAHRFARSGQWGIDWHVRSGPELRRSESLPAGWTVTDCSPADLGALLHTEGAPVVVLNGRAELGPRALGGRSIIAPAVDPAMKELLNEVKKREDYRPVAPICLTEHAPRIFDPGTPDPYMLFDHLVNDDWTERIPAVLHLDGTARLQTVCEEDDAVLTEILRAYHARSGIPVLCNTSANLNGCGFFPDVAAAVAWGKIGLVWSEGKLYRRESTA